MRLFSFTVLWIVFCMWMGMLFYGCANQGLRETWQDCAGVNHPAECDGFLGQDYLDCEYVYYKECIGE